MSANIRKPIRMPTFAVDQRIRAEAKSDPDALPLASKQLKAMIPLRVLDRHCKTAKR